MFDYSPLWETLHEKKLSTYELTVRYGISKGTIHQLKQNSNVTMQTIDKLCQITQSPVEKIVRVSPDSLADRAATYQKKLQDGTQL